MPHHSPAGDPTTPPVAGSTAPAGTPSGSTAAASFRAGARWFTLFTLAWLALWTVQLTPLQLLIPLQLDTPDDAGGWISGVVSSGLVLAVGGLAEVIAGPLAGGLSDRTRGAFGRRRPWVIGGVVLGSASLVGIAFAQSPWGVGVAWVGVSIGIAVASAAFTALIADQLTDQRGAASASIASSQAVGIVVGVGVIVLLGLGVVTGYLALAGFLLVAGVGAALWLPIRRHRPLRRPRARCAGCRNGSPPSATTISGGCSGVASSSTSATPSGRRCC
ncbi:MFS transporter [Microbacterium lacticum]|uniref:MFS transporter n=1 Tax=Microbacterium lacticum TaxID=33885 RepID=UPI0028D28B95|nr:MFS transporter [Microbacterium lacticum]